MRTKLLALFLVAVTLTTACGSSATATVLPPTAAPTSTPVVQTVVVEKVVTATPLPATPTLAFTATSPATNTPLPTLTPTEVLVIWTQVQVGKYSEWVEVNGQLWELVLSTHFAASTANGRYEAVESKPVGVQGNKDFGWCGDKQLDCPPHGLLVRVEVPAEHISCITAEMDISWRVHLENGCGMEVPVRFSIRYNDVTRSESELSADYFSLAGLDQRVQDAISEVGLFISVKEAGTSNGIGYSCWDCLADTMGVDEPNPVPLVAENFSTFGPDTPPAGESRYPGVVFPLPRPDGETYELAFELKVETDMVIWAGRYDARTLPTPTATSTLAPTITATPSQ